MSHPIPRLQLEQGIDPVMIGFRETDEGLEVSEMALWCVRTVAETVPRPDEITIAITADLAKSVQEVLMAGGIDTPYTAERGDGFVGGKTMQTGPGDYVILLQAFYFVDGSRVGEAPEVSRSRERLLRWTLIHETQHALYGQRGEQDFLPFAHNQPTTIRETLEDIARQFLDEYRAEAATATLTEAAEPTEDTGFAEALAHLDHALRGLYAYRARGGNLAAFTDGLLANFRVTWTALAYLGAWLRTEDGTLAPIPPVLAGDELWNRYVAADWAAMEAILETVPVVHAPSTDQLDDARTQMLRVFEQCLRTIGFDLTARNGVESIEFLQHCHDLAS